MSDSKKLQPLGVVEGVGFRIDWSVAKPDAVLEALIAQYRYLQDHPVGEGLSAHQSARLLGGVAELERKRHADREARGVRGTKKP